jgi:hypothetical protein
MCILDEVQTDEEILNDIKALHEPINAENTLDDDDEDISAPSPAEAISMMDKIRLTLLKNSQHATDFQSFDKLYSILTNIALSSKKQTTIKDYFQSTSSK